jgi:dsDNA-specific endonuclease/ATPase MutS2
LNVLTRHAELVEKYAKAERNLKDLKSEWSESIEKEKHYAERQLFLESCIRTQNRHLELLDEQLKKFLNSLSNVVLDTVLSDKETKEAIEKLEKRLNK